MSARGSKNKTAKKKASMPGRSPKAVALRHSMFADEYLKNGRNATQAAITLGYTEKWANKYAYRLLKKPDVQEKILARMEAIEKKSGLSVERTLIEVARVAYSDPRKFYDDKGNLIPVHQLSDEAAACIASLEVDEISGAEGVVIGHTKKIKQWDKNAALEKAMKHLGLFEKDNSQQPPPTVHLAGVKSVQFQPLKGRAAK